MHGDFRHFVVDVIDQTLHASSGVGRVSVLTAVIAVDISCDHAKARCDQTTYVPAFINTTRVVSK
jgi:hypothetical protein